MENKFWNVPNILTLVRFALIPVMLVCFFTIPGKDHLAAMIVFLVASLTDVLDGFIARATHQITPIGEVLDPLADKLLKISTLLAFAIAGILPVWLVSVLIFIDLGMIIAGASLFKQKITIPSNFFGKLGTLIISIGLLMCFFDGSVNPWDLYVLYMGLIIVVASLIIYILLNYKRAFFPNKANDAAKLIESNEVKPVENEEKQIEKDDSKLNESADLDKK